MTGDGTMAGPPAAQAPAPPPPEGMAPPPKKGMGLIIAVVVIIVIVVVLLLVYFLFIANGGPQGPGPITVNEWNAEYSSFLTSADFPGYDSGDTVTIEGTITDISTFGIELDNADIQGITFISDLSGTYNIGDNVRITFHITDLLGIEMIEGLGILDSTAISLI